MNHLLEGFSQGEVSFQSWEQNAAQLKLIGINKTQ